MGTIKCGVQLPIETKKEEKIIHFCYSKGMVSELIEF